MAGPMDGVRVVELAFWVAGPSAAAILADWGAEVVKIEPPDGDPFRGLFLSAAGLEVPANPPFELDNRGKRSIALDFTKETGREIALRLIDRADVFVTNLRPVVLARLGLDPDSLAARNPRLVYAGITGYGTEGPDRDRPAYDVGAFWSRAGIAAALTPPGTDPPFQRGAMGDHVAGITGAGAVASAAMMLSLMYWALVKVSGAAGAKTRIPRTCSRFSSWPGGHHTVLPGTRASSAQ